MSRLTSSIRLPQAFRHYPAKAILLGVVVVLVALNLIVPPANPVATTPVAPADLDTWFDDVVHDAGIPGAAIAVIEDGRIVHERGVGVADDTGRPVTPRTPFVIGSLAKSLTALAVGQLAERGRIDLDAPVRRYLPAFAVADPGASNAITVRQLLNQTSGLPGAAGTTPLSATATSLDAQVHALALVQLTSAPGAAFQYSNANYVVLGRLIEVVSGQSYEAYMQANVFGPLGMTRTSSVLATAQSDGLGQAHRLWFGLSDAHTPLFREDLAPAGFVASSVDDLARVLVAEMAGGRLGTTRIASPRTIDALWTGVAQAGPSGRYAMGWFDGTFDGERILAHTGSSTDMASFQAVIPSRGLGVVVLLDAQSVLYEGLHKPDSIGLAAVARLVGREAPGTLGFFYPAFDLFVLLIVGILVRNVVGLVRAPIAPRSRPWPASWRGRAMLIVRIYLDAVVPFAILTGAPVVLGAGWSLLVRIDVGLVLAAIAGLRLIDGIARVARTARAIMKSAGDATPALASGPAGLIAAADR